MALSHSPRIVTDGLVLCLDAANKKSFDPRENIYPHSETLQTLSNSRCSREVVTLGGPLERGYIEFTVTETSSAVYNFDSGNTITLTAGDIITFGILFQNVDVSGSIGLRCWTGSGRAWTTTRQVNYDLTTLTSTPTSGTILDHFITSESNGWYRLSMTVQADLTGFSAISTIFTATLGQKYRVTAVQVETGEYHNGYLQTNGTAIARSNIFYNLFPTSNGTLVNGVGYTGTNNGSMVFDGVSDYVEHTSDLSAINDITNTSPFTFSSIFKLNAFPAVQTGTNTGLLMKGSYNPAYGLNLRYSGDVGGFRTQAQIYYGLRNLTGTAGVTQGRGIFDRISNSFFQIGQWYKVDMVHEFAGTTHTLRLYVNGILDRQDTATDSLYPINFQNTLSLGVNFRILGGNFVHSNADIASYSIYNRALSEQEVRQNFNAVKGRFGL